MVWLLYVLKAICDPAQPVKARHAHADVHEFDLLKLREFMIWKSSMPRLLEIITFIFVPELNKNIKIMIFSSSCI
jgi:hypothetical protein